MKKLEKITPDFTECTLSSKEISMIKGGNMAEGEQTGPHRSETTGRTYNDHINERGEVVVDF